MSWVLLKRTDLSYDEVILVSGDIYWLSGSGRTDWQLLAQGSYADYDMLLKMAEMTGNFVELSVNRRMREVTNVSGA